jgi:hypothetical protein
MGHSKTLVIGLTMLAAAGCGSSNTTKTAPEPKSGSAQAQRSGSKVQIDNQNYADMDIYVLITGQRYLIGQAPGLNQTTLTLPVGITAAGGRVRLLADPIGGSRPITTPLLVVPRGQQIYWTIGSDPSTSTASTG